ncbi:MAG: alanine racemase, partial [Lachnospiraceae bacterium]|nr:alanine racemase [Lachnospiraceae bacterium]
YDQDAYAGADLQFIGTLQTNKVKYLIGKVSLIQSVGSDHLGKAIAKEAAKKDLCQDILIEVNIGREEAKSGLLPEELTSAVEELSALPSLRIRGLMAIPPIADQETGNTPYFQKMRQLYDGLAALDLPNVKMDYLSMGMTDDFREERLRHSLRRGGLVPPGRCPVFTVFIFHLPGKRCPESHRR